MLFDRFFVCLLFDNPDEKLNMLKTNVKFRNSLRK